MAVIRPFRALYYNPEKIKNLSNVFVPPYDVISEAQRKEFIRKSQYNFARIILGKDRFGGYKTAAEDFKKWRQNGILKLDAHRCFYVWEQKFYEDVTKRWCKRKQLVTLVSVDDFDRGMVVPHEHTLDAPKKDRFQIFKACEANLSPVFMMYPDKKQLLNRYIFKKLYKPMINVKDSGGVYNRLWRITDPVAQKFILHFFSRKKMYIIDGHHRFSTARSYAEFKGEKSTESPYRFVMTALTNMYDDSLVINPIYRALPAPHHLNKEAYLKRLYTNFYVTTSKKMSTLKKYQWGIVFHGDKNFYTLELKQPRKMIQQLKGHKSVKELDVYILHQLIIPKDMQSHVQYIRGSGEPLADAFKELKNGSLNAMWLLKSAAVDDVKHVADARQIMPPKSTYFYPKILSGPLIRLFI